MVQPVVAEFVGDDGLDLVLGELIEQVVEENDALTAAEAGEVGVAVRRSPLAVDDENSLAAKTGTREQRL